jgi:signal transduction histidine kinase/DNA-binding LacI/PurR family transcriptional regulator/CheY-like chemotaxis protein
MNDKKTICYFSIDLSNPFGETLLGSIRQRAQKYGFNLFVVHGGSIDSPNEWEIQRNVLYRWIRKERIDALIVANIFGFVGADAIPSFLKPFADIPTVLLSEKAPGMHSIIIDNAPGFMDLARYLIVNCGRKKFAMITGPLNSTDSNERLRAIMAVMEEYDIELDPANVYIGTYGSNSAINGIRTLIDDRKADFDTLVCFNDFMAIAAMEELKKRGYRIPDDIRVTGFDNTYESVYTNPPLTTVEYPIHRMGETAIDFIRDIFDERNIPATTTLISHFIPRLSSGLPSEKDPDKPKLRTMRCADTVPNTGNFRIYFFDTLFKTICDGILDESRMFITEERKRWFVETFRNIMEVILLNDSSDITRFSEYLERMIFSSHANEWSITLWTVAFKTVSDKLKSVADPTCDTSRDKARSALHLSRMYDNSYTINKLMLKSIKEEYLFQLGEDLGTAFDTSLIAPLLAEYGSAIGIDNFLAFEYTDESMKHVRLIARIENGRILSVKDFGEFRPDNIPPPLLPEKLPSMIMEALFVKEEELGFLLFNIGNHPGILYKSIRHQISGAIKGAKLVSTINRYSGELELMVQERTDKLRQLNEDLHSEIRRRETAERELLKQKNLDSLGLLAGGIAHDFNNILTAISGNINMLQISDDAGEHRDQLLESTMKAVGNAKHLTDQLLTFSKGGSPIKKAMSILPIIEETATFILRGSNVKPAFLFAPDISTIEIDPGQISQVLNNIILNATHAMPEGGKITFTVANRTIDDAPHNVKPGQYVNITISDTGYGIPPEIIDRIFDPYFTTKEKGFGLGLSTSLTIIRKHDGDILVTSEKGKGAEFNILLPVSGKTGVVDENEGAAEIPSGLRILVLEDDPQVCQVFNRFMNKTGQESIITSDGKDTLREYENKMRDGTPFDIVIMDLTIPGGMGGIETMEKILAIDPHARGIVTSGYSNVPVMANKNEYGFKAILKKPFTFNEFKAAVREAFMA